MAKQEPASAPPAETTDQAVGQKPAAPPADPNEGRGGSYIRDPQTGARRLVERTGL